jgi:hypothetical protein
MDISIPKPGNIRIRNDGFNIFLVSGTGVTVALPWSAALEVAKEMTAQARKIEEVVKANQIIADQALLIRTGIPLGLSDNPDIKKEALKQAQWDPKLRKYITGSRVRGIPSGEVMGTPGVIQHKPKEAING